MRYAFGDYILDTTSYTLLCVGVPIKIEPKVYETLVYLITVRDRFVSRDELISQLWPGQVVSDAAVTRCIAEARKAVGDDGERQHVIRTQYTRGYRWIAAVQELAISDGHAALSPPIRDNVSLESSPRTDPRVTSTSEERVTREKEPHQKHEVMFRDLRRWPYAIHVGGAATLLLLFILVSWQTTLKPGAIMQSLYARVLLLPFSTPAQRWQTHMIRSLEASELVGRGWDAYIRSTPESNLLARQSFTQAIARTPHRAEPYIGLGWTYWREWVLLWSAEPELLDRATTAVQQALKHDPLSSQAYTLLSAVALVQRQHDRALTSAREAVRLNPMDAGAAAMLAEVLIFTGQPQSALPFVEKAQALDPTAVSYTLTLGHIYRMLGRPDEALAPLQRALRSPLAAAFARTQLVLAYHELGKDEQAWAEWKTLTREQQTLALSDLMRRLPYQNSADAQRFAADLQRIASR